MEAQALRRDRPRRPPGPGLAEHPLLRGCSGHVMRRIASITDEVRVLAGDVLVQQGQPAFWFFLIDDGHADVVRNGQQWQALGPGGHFGEVALIGRGWQPATVQARTDMTLFVMGSQRFLPLVADVRRLRSALEAAVAGQSPLVDLARAERSARVRAVAAPTPTRPEPTRPLSVLRAPLPATPRARPARRVLARRAWIFAVVLIAMALPASAAYHPNVVSVGPGPTFDVAGDITISGVPVHPARGRYLLTSVRTQRPTLLGLGLTVIRGESSILPPARAAADTVRSGDPVSSDTDAFRRSRVLAAAAAARAVGLPVTLHGTGARIAHLVPGLLGSLDVRVGDVIVAVDGRPVSTAQDVGPALAVQPPGSPFRLTLERDGRRVHVDLVTAALEGGVGGLAGTTLDTRNMAVDLPFTVSFRDRPIVGPSAGLVYALAMADMLSGTDRVRGRTIAATGEIDPLGTVMPVRFSAEKAGAARRGGAQLFLVPAADARVASGHGVRIQGVVSLEDALRQIAAGDPN